MIWVRLACSPSGSLIHGRRQAFRLLGEGVPARRTGRRMPALSSVRASMGTNPVYHTCHTGWCVMQTGVVVVDRLKTCTALCGIDGQAENCVEVDPFLKK